MRMRAVPAVSFAVSQALNGQSAGTLVALSAETAVAQLVAAATGSLRATFDTVVFDCEL